jgi:hypothetical protein
MWGGIFDFIGEEIWLGSCSFFIGTFPNAGCWSWYEKDCRDGEESTKEQGRITLVVIGFGAACDGLAKRQSAKQDIVPTWEVFDV